ncbi:unnamed protein product [Rotaria sordida]|uniref:Pentatricopeptide repeat-containing protein n=1 Tax=Rotaria sordida TaxID=392033 RepID=A0A819W1F2_9BILA|nr:unnamed protein product [Rotaria sordida]CAF1452307.1 unnamed protein product [Rotaria sordida]CAF3716549.1 unnamed protein product [Rotaria sordida]CAF4117022.1 unnamed protein product [Rotaria sordida]
MLKKLLDHRLIFLTSGIKRSVIIPSDFDLCTQMKLLNDKKKFKEALELFDKYKENNNKTLSSYTITQALKASARIRDLQRGSTIHQFISSDMKDNSYILVSLIHLYMQCSEVTRAQSLFDTASEKSLHTYGAMMKGYIKNHMTNKAIDLFKEIKNPDEVIIIILCNAGAQLGTNEALSLIKKVSSQMPKHFYSNLRLLTSLLDVLMQCGDVKHAQALFDTSTTKILSMYGAMMKGYIKNNMATKAIDLFKEIKDPDEIVINLLFTACAELGTSEALNLTKIVSSQMPKHFYSNLRLLTSLLDALIQCGNVTHAEALFNRSIKKISPLYGVMMKGYNTNNMANKSIDLFNEIENPDDVNFIMLFNACAQLGTHEALNLIKKVLSQIPKHFYSNFHLLTSQLDALIKCGDFSTAEILLSKMKKSVISYGNLMSGYLKTDNPEKVLDLFDRMKNDNIEPDFIIYLCLIKALSHIGDYSLSQLTVQQIPNSFLLNDRIQNTLIDMWVSSN